MVTKTEREQLKAATQLRDKYTPLPSDDEDGFAVRINTRREPGQSTQSSFLGLYAERDAWALVGEIAAALGGTVEHTALHSLRVYWGGPTYLSTAEVAAACGLASSTVRMYRARGQMPEADVMVGTIPGWLPETIEAYKVTLPGRGARTDLHS